MELSNPKVVLVTGAGGFIGLRIVSVFARKGWMVLAVVHKNIPDELKYFKNIDIIKADISCEKSLRNAIEDIIPDVVIHAAGIVSDIGSDKEFKRINFEPVKYLALMPKEKFIYISSSDVYGIKDFNGEKEEELPFLEYPKNPYPRYKIKCEKWLRENIKSSKYAIIRPAAVWGCGDKTLGKRTIDFLRVSPYIVHFGRHKGKNRWPLADVKSVAKVAYVLSVSDKFNGEAVNVIDEKRTTIDEYYRNLARENFPLKKYKTIYLPLWFGKILGFISTLTANIFKLKEPFDPTFYAVHHISSNLDFSSEKMTRVLKYYDVL